MAGPKFRFFGPTKKCRAGFLLAGECPFLGKQIREGRRRVAPGHRSRPRPVAGKLGLRPQVGARAYRNVGPAWRKHTAARYGNEPGPVPK
jgi:hypothetical protein